MADGAFIGAPPSELSAFRAGRAVSLGRKPPSAGFEIRCAECGGAKFEAFVRTHGNADGETQVGIVLACAGCHHRSDLFDLRRHGYDGRFDHWKSLQGACTEQPLATMRGAASIRAEYLYNIPTDELLEHAQETSVPPQDFYDWFTLRARRGWRWITVWDCECA